MAAQGTRGGLGWVILVVALAVPGVLFYNWWSHLKAEQAKAVSAKASARLPDAGVFQTAPGAGKLVNPMTPVASTAPAVAAASAPVVAVAAVAVATAAAPAPAPAPTTAPPASSGAASFSTSTAAALPLKRDPTLSPYDQVRLMEEEEARRRAAEELEALKNRKSAPKVVKKIDPRTLVELQGIISGADGFKAIVNGDLVGVGETVNKVRVVRINDAGVVFDFKGQKFTKTVSRDE